MGWSTLVSNSQPSTHLLANPLYQRLHVGVKNPACARALAGATVTFDFGDYCGAGLCYHYWPVQKITSVTPDSLETQVLAACQTEVPGYCDGKYVKNWHATVSLMEGLTNDKKDWLNSKTWSLQTWTIQEEPAPYAQCYAGPDIR